MKQCCIMVHHTPLTLVIHMPNVWLMYRTGEWWGGKKLQRSLSLDWSATLFRTHSGNLWLNWWLPLGVFSCPVQNNSEDECSKCSFFKVTFLPDRKSLVVTNKNGALIHEKFGEVMLGRRTYFLSTSYNLVFLKIWRNISSKLFNQLPRLRGRWVPGLPRSFHSGQPAPR